MADRPLRLTPGAAGRQSRDARHLSGLPRTADAFLDGSITAAQAAAAAQAVRDLPSDALAGLDLVMEQGPNIDPDQLRSAIDTYVHHVDADNLANRDERAHRHRRLTITRTPSEAVAGEFRLDPLAGETLLTAIAAHTGTAGRLPALGRRPRLTGRHRRPTPRPGRPRRRLRRLAPRWPGVRTTTSDIGSTSGRRLL